MNFNGGTVDNKRRESLLALAKAADEKADKATDGQLKDSWRKIADGYRDLARRA